MWIFLQLWNMCSITQWIAIRIALKIAADSIKWRQSSKSEQFVTKCKTLLPIDSSTRTIKIQIYHRHLKVKAFDIYHWDMNVCLSLLKFITDCFEYFESNDDGSSFEEIVDKRLIPSPKARIFICWIDRKHHSIYIF